MKQEFWAYGPKGRFGLLLWRYTLMHNIQPFENWQHLYNPANDPQSPFFGRTYHETLCTHTVYNYYIHPQWDDFGSPTLYMKLLYADYRLGFCIIELMGEWNDCLNNDIMFLKRDVVDVLLQNHIRHFILIGENVLNFHADTDDYYQEWFEDVEDGFIFCINFRAHVVQEFKSSRLDNYLVFGGRFNELPWRRQRPQELFGTLALMMTRRLNP